MLYTPLGRVLTAKGSFHGMSARIVVAADAGGSTVTLFDKDGRITARAFLTELEIAHLWLSIVIAATGEPDCQSAEGGPSSTSEVP